MEIPANNQPVFTLKAKKPKGFRSFNLNDNLIRGIRKIGYKQPTPIQKKTIPEIMSGFNIFANSRTGSGKTAAFLLPMLNNLKEHSKLVGCRSLIISPSRELALQTFKFCRKLGQFTNLRCTLLVGGLEIEGQFEKLAQNPDIIIATPGRVVHHLQEGSLSLKKVEVLAIDEADKMFELNFEEHLREILKSCPMSRQVLFFSASIPQQLAQFMKTGIRDYKLINIEDENRIPDKLKVHILYTRTEEKKFTFVSLLSNKNVIDIDRESTLVFVKTKYHCEYMHEFLKFWNIDSLYIYGQMEQELRNKNLERFKRKSVNVLIVTDLAARGLDIPLLNNVVNFNFPDNTKLFIHRVGRTARAGNEGRVFNLCSAQELPYFFDIKVNLGKKLDLEMTNADPADFKTVSFGQVPQSELSLTKQSMREMLNYKVDMEGLEDSCRKATTKASAFRQEPSKFGVRQAKRIIGEEIPVHPLFARKENVAEHQEVQQFLKELKNFKPKETYFERINETNVQENVIKEFKSKAKEFKRKKEIDRKKEEFNYEDQNETEEEAEDNAEVIAEGRQKPLSLLGKKVKRSKIRNFKNNPHFVKDTKQGDSKSLWGGEKPLSLDELTLNIAPDDENASKRRKLVWDPKKKNFVMGNLDRAGNLIKTNEAGTKVKDADKKPKLFQKWKKKNKMRVQSVGETENDKLVSNAETIFKDRKFNKQNKHSNAGKSEVKSFDQLLKSKKEKFKINSKKNFSKRVAKQNAIGSKAHVNKRSQALIRKRRK